MEGTFKPARSGCAETLIAAESRHIGTNRFLDECIGDYLAPIEISWAKASQSTLEMRQPSLLPDAVPSNLALSSWRSERKIYSGRQGWKQLPVLVLYYVIG